MNSLLPDFSICVLFDAYGKGAAIIPSEGKLVSPFDGVVEMVFATKHAIGLKSNNGCEVLIHIGLDTVKLEGKYFDVLVKEGQEIKKGMPLMHFDIDAMKNEGYDLTTPIVITNVDQYEKIDTIAQGNIECGVPFLKTN